MIYLDNAATTKIDPVVLEAMMPYLTGEYGNPGSIYPLGNRASTAVHNARKQVARMMGADESNIIFTSSGTEANNLAFNSCLHYGVENNRDIILISAVEHSSVVNFAEFLHIKYGFYIIKIAVNPNGTIDFNDLIANLDKYHNRIALVSIMLVNNEIGSINNAFRISQECRERGVLCHFDCVQAAGSVDIGVGFLGCDFASISSHKIHGPKGVGALYVKDRYYITPLIHGGSNQEFGLRGGTQNVAGIVGFGEACRLVGLYEHGTRSVQVSTKRKFIEYLKEEFKSKDILNLLSFNADSDLNVSKVLSVRLDGIDAETMVIALGANGVCVSAGSACRSLEQTPSSVLKAVGLSDDEARDTLRISFSRMNTHEEVERAAGIIAETALFIYNNTVHTERRPYG